MEFKRILLQDEVDEKALFSILPELISLKECQQLHPAHIYNVLDHTIKVVMSVPKDPLLRVSALLHDIGKPTCKIVSDDGVEHFWGHEKEGAKIANKLLCKLGFDKEFINKVTRIIEVHDIKIQPSVQEVKKAIEDIGKDIFGQLLILQRADLLAHEPEYAKRKLPYLNEIERIYKNITFIGSD